MFFLLLIFQIFNIFSMKNSDFGNLSFSNGSDSDSGSKKLDFFEYFPKKILKKNLII